MGAKMDEEKRGAMEYQAMATFEVQSDVPRRDIVMVFRGMPEEEYNLAVRLPAGAAATLSVMMHKACSDIDNSVADKAAHMQPMELTEASAADPSMGKCSLLLGLNGFQVPTLFSKQTALHLIAELEQAVRNLEKPEKPRRLS
jgi:hypothetical protein